MRLEHEFSVPAPVDDVWQALLDPERVAPCMPGATLTGVDGDTFTATVKVKLGPVALQYKGTGEFVEKDDEARKLVIKASGKDIRGAGTASCTSTVTLSEGNGSTHGAVVSDLKVTGRPAQFGRGLIAEVGGRLLGEFAANLADSLARDTPSAGTDDEVREPADVIDLMEVAGTPVLKRVLPVLAAVLIAIAVLRARRKG